MREQGDFKRLFYDKKSQTSLATNGIIIRNVTFSNLFNSLHDEILKNASESFMPLHAAVLHTYQSHWETSPSPSQLSSTRTFYWNELLSLWENRTTKGRTCHSRAWSSRLVLPHSRILRPASTPSNLLAKAHSTTSMENVQSRTAISTRLTSARYHFLKQNFIRVINTTLATSVFPESEKEGLSTLYWNPLTWTSTISKAIDLSRTSPTSPSLLRRPCTFSSPSLNLITSFSRPTSQLTDLATLLNLHLSESTATSS